MINEITPDQLPDDMKAAFDEWHTYFVESVNALSFKPYTGYSGEDKNLLAWRSKEEFIAWYGQPPGNEPYRDNGFYTRELSWLSLWCNPKIVLEIGTDKGIGTFLLSRLDSQALIHTLDIKPTVKMPDDSDIETGYFAKENQFNIIFEQMDSKDYKLADVDLCFIDGDHSKEAVWNDSLAAWWNRHKARRWVIVWHDYRDGEEFRGLKTSIHRFSQTVARKPVFKLTDSATVWMTNE